VAPLRPSARHFRRSRDATSDDDGSARRGAAPDGAPAGERRDPLVAGADHAPRVPNDYRPTSSGCCKVSG
jgi:hypothetical protein